MLLADRLHKPLLIEGPAGCGKTRAGQRCWRRRSGTDLYRLQCYEGLDEAKALYEWAYPKQLLYTQILRDKIGELLVGSDSLSEAVAKIASHEDAFFSERFLLARPLPRALRAPRRVVLLIDEVDRAESGLKRFSSKCCRTFRCRFPSWGRCARITFRSCCSRRTAPREMTDALKRRCLFCM